MLRNVILMSSSGILMFSKEFVSSVAQPRLTGSLISAIVASSALTVGMPVSLIELTDVSVSVVIDEKTRIICALFHDQEDGAAFGKLIASEILRAFVEEYGADLGSGAGHNLKDFHGFHFKIAEVIRNSVRPVLRQLQYQRGIEMAVLVTDDAVTHASVDATVEVDRLGVLANLQGLLGVASDILSVADDVPRHIALDGPRSSRLLLYRLKGATLVVKCSHSVNQRKTMAAVGDAVQVLGRVCLLLSNLHHYHR